MPALARCTHVNHNEATSVPASKADYTPEPNMAHQTVWPITSPSKFQQGCYKIAPKVKRPNQQPKRTPLTKKAQTNLRQNCCTCIPSALVFMHEVPSPHYRSHSHLCPLLPLPPAARGTLCATASLTQACVRQETAQAYDRTRTLFQALTIAPAAMVAALEQGSWRFSAQENAALLQVCIASLSSSSLAVASLAVVPICSCAGSQINSLTQVLTG